MITDKNDYMITPLQSAGSYPLLFTDNPQDLIELANQLIHLTKDEGETSRRAAGWAVVSSETFVKRYGFRVVLQSDPATQPSPKEEPAAPVTKKEFEVLSHAIGLNSKTPGYRNHFCTGEGSDDYPAWMLRHAKCDQQSRDENYVLANMWLEREGIDQMSVEEGGHPFHYPKEQVYRCLKCHRVMTVDECTMCHIEKQHE